MIKVLELFAGIGACSKALENLGIEHEIVDAVEIDKYAIAAFNAIHGTNFEPQDITKWDKDIECDLIMHGSPCQDFSIAGKQAGGDEGSGTQSSLMYETLRIVDKLRPKYVIWENVKNLLSKKHVHNWNAYAEYMEELGYVNYCQVLNAKDYGIPQNRERVFTVSIRVPGPIPEAIKKMLFRFPPRRPLARRLKDMLEDEVGESCYLNNDQTKGLVFDIPNVSYCIDANYWKGTTPKQYLTKHRRQLVAIKTANTKGYDLAIDGDGIDLGYPDSKTRRGRVGHGVAKTLPTSDSQGVLDGLRIRKLTPKECYRLMGFDDASFERAAKVISNTQLYKTAGNSIVVPVLEAILKELLCK